MEVTPTPLLTRAELAQRWRMSTRTLETWCRDERGPQPRRFGKRALYLLSDVERFERERFEQEQAPQEPRGIVRQQSMREAVTA